MADVEQSVDFKAIVARTSAVLLTRGVEVEPVAGCQTASGEARVVSRASATVAAERMVVASTHIVSIRLTLVPGLSVPGVAYPAPSAPPSAPLNPTGLDYLTVRRAEIYDGRSRH
ncbi:hypothetical protein [Streptomyces sp. 150FB]|uniref:hypothetical protein n=1 Tax=Streptomyces sp. 150FB TaxID=1576605 RepID=UPI0012374548|nr:hypothetical protein [Streptomyces sp. 150FB]